MDAYLYLISASYVSHARFRTLSEALVRAAPCPAHAVRLDASGDGMWSALDALYAQGATRIELRPIGLPFSQSLEKWLPGAAGSWLDRQGAKAPDLFMAAVPQADSRVVHSAARARVALTRIRPKAAGEIGRGWDAPPDFRHHLLVCAGPRCHLKDAPSLADALKVELGRARVRSQCLVTTTGCLFPCNAGPVIVHYPQGHWYRVADLADIRCFVSQALREGTRPHHLLIHQTGDQYEPA
ncbi:hypothetical protein GCM10016455_28360 [Aliiroseovarius zhejiangensis]|uniref:(2Fe-2S) ferredoxin domain-containing protein n=1 Tax=Aliiroseovarius zhejiangensis TaxID=1632025 RepID=A0ABQ3J578_9RHOB|nr:(2Fe-2S) ferredoxin domain-containing protein [Aliiroseovarius zhejiangensis]GHF05413.1 hypothetical protein GCM10016455_28360 [Aliiroseovarius zhejiangensis]